MTWVGAGVAVAGAVAGGVESSQANKAASSAAGRANAPFNALINTGLGLINTPYTPYTGELVAPESGNELAAGALAPQIQGQEAPLLAQAGQQWNSATLQKYMNPYVQQAINVPEQQLALNYGEQTAELSRKSGMMDAFGFGRSAENQGVLNRNYETEFGNIQATGMANAYNAAQGAFQADVGRYSKLASEVGALGSQNINALLTTGQNERSIAQAKDTSAYGQFQNQQNWAINRFNEVAGAVNGAASHIVTPQPSSVLGGVMGGALAGYGMYSGMNKGGGSPGGGGDLSEVTLNTDTTPMAYPTTGLSAGGTDTGTGGGFGYDPTPQASNSPVFA